MKNGEIRVNKIKDNDYRDLSDYWCLAMHNNQNGFIPTLCFSYDEKYFFSCGHDGNVFSYTFHADDEDYISSKDFPRITKRTKFPESLADEPNYNKPNLEQASLRKEQDRIDKLAANHCEMLREKLKTLRQRFHTVLKRNKNLLTSQIIPIEQLEVDFRVTTHLTRKLEEELALVKRKLAFDLEKSEIRMTKIRNHFIDNLAYIPIIVSGLKSDVSVRMLRQRKIEADVEEILEFVEKKILENASKSRYVENRVYKLIIFLF